MEQKAKHVQDAFLKRVKSALPENIALVDELADLLELSNDSAYRRLRGETPLNIEEIMKICSHFAIPFETDVHPDSDTVTFNFFKLEGKKENFKKWLTTLLQNVNRIASVSHGDIVYAADDVPVWHHFIDEEFASFKIFYWLKCIISAPEFVDKNFDSKLVDQELIDMAKELAKSYDKTKSTEIWTEDTLNSTLKQIEYFWESGFFNSKQDALRICDLFVEELNLVLKKASKSSKLVEKNQSGKENFKLYKSEVIIGNNSILANIGSTKIAYVSNNTFNMMSTTSADFVHENELWLNNLLRKSTLISGVAEKQRNQFFRVLREKVELVRQRIIVS